MCGRAHAPLSQGVHGLTHHSSGIWSPFFTGLAHSYQWAIPTTHWASPSIGCQGSFFAFLMLSDKDLTQPLQGFEYIKVIKAIGIVYGHGGIEVRNH